MLIYIESPCPIPKVTKWPKGEDEKEQRTKYFKEREQSLPIPSKRKHAVDNVNHTSSAEMACPLLNPQVSSQKQRKVSQKSEKERARLPTLRTEYPSAQSSTSLPNRQAQTTNDQQSLSKSKESTSKSSSTSEPPVIKLEERRMWKTIWNAEGSKEPLEQYIIRKRSEVVYRLPKVRANAQKKAVARDSNKQAETGMKFNVFYLNIEKQLLGN